MRPAPQIAAGSVAASILADATRQGDRLSQAALAERLRSQGHRIANERLRWLLAKASNLYLYAIFWCVCKPSQREIADALNGYARENS